MTYPLMPLLLEVNESVFVHSVSDPETGKKKARSSESKKRKLLVGDTYDPSSPTSENSCDESPAAKRAAVSNASGATQAKPTTKARKSLPELEKYWKAVKEDSSDFTGWTYLLQYVDQEVCA
jgi:pre-mRNA-processing factor 39